MANRAQKNKKSKEIKKNDGRRNNKRLAPKPISTASTLPARKNTKAKKERISSYAISSMKSQFGSERQFFDFLAEKSRTSYSHMKLFLEYAYGKPSDQISDGGGKQKSTPIIQFVNNQAPVKTEEKTIDIPHE